jgi:hypothetical protein
MDWIYLLAAFFAGVLFQTWAIFRLLKAEALAVKLRQIGKGRKRSDCGSGLEWEL